MNYTIYSVIFSCFVALVRAVEFEITQGWTENGKMVLKSNKFDFDNPICPVAASYDTFIRLDSSESAHNLSIMTPSMAYENKGKHDVEPKLNFWEFETLRDNLMRFVRSAISIELQPGQSLFNTLMETEKQALFVGATLSDGAAVTLYMGSPHPDAYILLYKTNSAALEVIRSVDFDQHDIDHPLIRKLNVGSTLILTNFYNAHEVAGDAAHMLSKQVDDGFQWSYTQAYVDLFNYDARTYDRNPSGLVKLIALHRLS